MLTKNNKRNSQKQQNEPLQSHHHSHDNDSPPLTVTTLNYLAKDMLENNFPQVWVEGEISNTACPSSGHIYFTLKDSQAQIRAAMFKGHNRRLTFRPQNGQQVTVRGKISLYTPRGDYQLLVDQMEAAGDGALRRAYETLKKQLAQEGLFDESIKQTLPTLPSQIGVITSPTGAAIRDIISVLKHRFPGIPIIIYPAAVQGEGAATEIAQAIQTANTSGVCDVLIVGRGGGSLEDLWAFNEEIVARAVYHSTIPIVSAVGHQTDFTIIDFVADHRAPTPSAAAERLSPTREEWLSTLRTFQRRFKRQIQTITAHHQQTLSHLQKRLTHPRRHLEEFGQRLDDLESRLTLAVQQHLITQKNCLSINSATLQQHDPRHRITQQFNQSKALTIRLKNAMKHFTQQQQIKFVSLSQRLNSVSPLATLQRGYSITQTEQNQLIRHVQQISPGDRIKTQLQSGSILSEVIEKKS
jgi:exodeoxyribonuclease VII large subunit